MHQVELMANQAVFQLQLNSNNAVRYIQRNAGVDQATARQALMRTVTFYKQK